MEKANRLYFFLVLIFLIILLGYLTYEIIKPFVYPISWAIVLSILFYPLYAFIGHHTKRRSLSAFLVLAVVLLIFIGPAFYLTSLLIEEVASLSYLLETGRIDALRDVFERPVVRKGLEEVASLINMSEEELIGAIMNYVAGLGRRSIAGIARGIHGIMIAALGFILMALTFFFMLRDGPVFLRNVRDYLPFSEEQKDALLKRVSDIVFSTIYGGVVVALAQGAAGGAVFALLGISTPVFWGFVIAVVSFLPVVGPGMIWIPAAAYLFLNDAVIKGMLLVAAGIGIAAIDAFLRPLIIGNRTRMPFLIIFFSVIGGIQFFGFIGFILGPLVLALFIAVLEVLGSMNGPTPERAKGNKDDRN